VKGGDGNGPDAAGARPAACEPDPLTGRCATCADEAQPAVLLELLPDGLARAALPDGTREISVELLDEPRPGETVLVHAGVALARLE
jgi:hypothetical protein